MFCEGAWCLVQKSPGSNWGFAASSWNFHFNNLHLPVITEKKQTRIPRQSSRCLGRAHKRPLSPPVSLVAPWKAELNRQFLSSCGSLEQAKASVHRSGERKSSSAHYREKGAVRVAPSFIPPPSPAFFWPREWKLKSNSQNEWWSCIVCTKQSRRLLRAIEGAPSKGSRHAQLLVSLISLWQRLVLEQPQWEGRPPSFCIHKHRLEGPRMHKMNSNAETFTFGQREKD